MRLVLRLPTRGCTLVGESHQVLMVGVCQACSLEASSFATAPVRSSLASGVSPLLFHLFLHVSLWCLRGCWSRRSISPLCRWPLLCKHQGRSWWWPLAGLPWIPLTVLCVSRLHQPLGTNAQAHLLVMSLNVAKCNLGKVNLKAMLASGFVPKRCGGALAFSQGHLVTHTRNRLLAAFRKESFAQ